MDKERVKHDGCCVPVLAYNVALAQGQERLGQVPIAITRWDDRWQRRSEERPTLHVAYCMGEGNKQRTPRRSPHPSLGARVVVKPYRYCLLHSPTSQH